MNLLNLSNSNLRNCVHAIISQLNADGFKPHYIVGVTRGGLIPAVMLSHYLNVPMHTLKVSLLEGSDDDCESNLWMSEDAFGYVPKEEQEIIAKKVILEKKKLKAWYKKSDPGLAVLEKRFPWKAVLNSTILVLIGIYFLGINRYLLWKKTQALKKY